VGDEEATALAAAVGAPWLTGGPAVGRFEAALAEVVGARHAVAVSSGTAALHVAYLAAGLRSGDTLLTSPITFVATASAASHCDAIARFADVDAHGSLDPAAVARALGGCPTPRIVVPVHYAGHPAAVEAIAAASRDAVIIEDACHALGAVYPDTNGTWRRVGGCAHSAMAVFSFHPVKAITTGEGGAVTTNDDLLAARCRRLRDHGLDRTPAGADGPWCYALEEIGFNYRLSDLHATLGVVQLGRLEDFVARRRAVAAAYDGVLARVPGVTPVVPPAGTRSAYHLYPVRVPGALRRRVFERLRARGIGVQVHYYPLHLQPYYRRLLGTGPGSLPAAERMYRELLSLPCFPGMEERDVAHVVGALAESLEEARDRGADDHAA
jgi:dTDP-4-amino-4,6-dideoxygalactose transaminase